MNDDNKTQIKKFEKTLYIKLSKKDAEKILEKIIKENKNDTNKIYFEKTYSIFKNYILRSRL